MTVLILGGTGFIGPRTAGALGALGAEVVCASRSGTGTNGLALDRNDPSAVRALIRERGVDTVIDLLARTSADTLPLLDRLDGVIGRYVLIGSADVYRNYEGLQRKGAPPVIQAPLREASPLRESRFPYRGDTPRAPDDPDRWYDDYDKIPLEEAVRARPGLGGVILRLPMVYGPGDRQRRFAWIIRTLNKSPAVVRADPGLLHWRTTYGYIDDVASAIALAGLHPDAGARTFNIGEADPPSHDAWIARFAQATDVPVEVESKPFADGDPRAAADFCYPLVLDTTAVRQTLGWCEPTLLHDALLATIADEQSRQ